MVASFLANASQVLLFLLGVFLIIVILLQRGRGGGLAGAFGGMGGQSAFGTKAGDVFTRITIVLAICWVILAGGSGVLLRAAAKGQGGSQFKSSGAETAKEEPGAAGSTESTGAGASGAPESPAGGTAPAPTSGTPESGGAATPEGSPTSDSPATKDKESLPAPTAAPENGSAGSPPADSTAPASSTPEHPTSTPQDK